MCVSYAIQANPSGLFDFDLIFSLFLIFFLLFFGGVVAPDGGSLTMLTQSALGQ